jgi:hypothetical protein
MDFMRVVFGLLIAATGFVAVLTVLIVFTHLSFPGPIEPSDDPVYLYTDWLFGIVPERNINNGQPSLHAALLATVAVKQGERVAHIGAGAGDTRMPMRYGERVLASRGGMARAAKQQGRAQFAIGQKSAMKPSML